MHPLVPFLTFLTFLTFHLSMNVFSFFSLILVQTTDGISVHHVQVNFVAAEITDVVDPVLDHRGALQRQAPGDD